MEHHDRCVIEQSAQRGVCERERARERENSPFRLHSSNKQKKSIQVDATLLDPALQIDE